MGCPEGGLAIQVITQPELRPSEHGGGRVKTTDLYLDIREGVQRACADFDDAYWRGHDVREEFPWRFYERMSSGGWIGIAIPERYGGAGQGITAASIALEEIAASGAGMNGASCIHLSMFAALPIVKHGSDDVRDRYLGRLASGELHISFGITEPDAGTDTMAIQTKADRVDGGYLVRGRKVWMTKATISEKVLLLVRTSAGSSGERRSAGLTLLLADLKSPQVHVRAIPKLGRNAVTSCEVAFDDLFVPEFDRVGEEGEGFRYLVDALNAERILVAAEALGVGRVALDRACRYAKNRNVFGRPIGQNQGVAHPLADAYAHLRAAELAIRDASARYDRGEAAGTASNIAKYLAAEAGFLSADRAMQTLGGMGYAREYDVERYWREARLFRIAPVPQEMILNFLSTHVLGLPRSY